MALKATIKVLEYGIGLGTAVLFLWLPLSLALATVLSGLELRSAQAAEIGAAVCNGVGLTGSMALAGMLAGLMLTEGRWLFSATALVVAVAFRTAIHFISADPVSPWTGATGIAIAAGSVVAGLFASVGGFALVQRWQRRRSASN
jgi:hypothetical protein